MPEDILVVPQIELSPGARWAPVVGPELSALLRDLPEESRGNVEREAVSILERSVPPDAPDERSTGLVVGYVQSGKTLSFTAVSALAQDNGFRVVIVLTGTSVNLFKQSVRRLRDDLRLTNRERRWKLFSSDTLRLADGRSIEAALRRWTDRQVPDEERQTVLLTVMKEKSHLERLTRVIESLGVSLSGVPVLIIDDEADQASLNNMVSRSSESPTYRRLLRIRRLFPHHTFLQYTATPQANLLISLIDTLSPDFAETLTPGAEYTGGRVFFEQNHQLIRPIPDADVPTTNNVLAAPPQSLLDALRVFFLGVAAGMIRRHPQSNRSMMVHPSQRVTQHEDFTHWVNQAIIRWEAGLSANNWHDASYHETVAEFQRSYGDLAQTTSDLPSLDELIEVLPRVLRETVVTEVNARPGRDSRQGTPEINWERDYAHILVGGTALDRGYTVEGLTVTYMPRGRGVGNADTIQQRARWFGYKAGYLGYCRVYLAEDTKRDYIGYVEHEESVRAQLREHRQSGVTLKQWRRKFLLLPSLRPTRNAVVSRDYERGALTNQWFWQRTPHHSADVDPNRQLFAALKSRYTFDPTEGHPERRAAHRHRLASAVSLREVYEEFLTRYEAPSVADSPRFTGMLLQIARYLDDNPQAACDILWMRPDMDEPVYRTVDEDNRIKYLFQGAYPDNRGEIYAGDQAMKATSRLTLQLHHLDEVRAETANGEPASVLGRDVPALAVWVPRDFGRGWLVEERTSEADGG